ncbi:noggin-2-like [Polymixia lowei]
MLRPVSWLKNCGIPLYWISMSVLLNGPSALPSNTQNQLLNVTVVQNQKDTDWDLSFLQLRASLTSSLQPIRPYSLLIHAEDYHYMPKPKHLRPSRLLRVLGSSFDPFWMSIERPSEVSGVLTSEVGGDTPPGPLPNYTTIREGFNLSASPELIKGAAHYRQKLEKEAADLDLSFLPPDVSSSVRAWLVRSASCALRYRWVDLGPAFWPRWLRHTDCEKSDGLQSCSFPSGMECLWAQIAHIRILAWHCWGHEQTGDGSKMMAEGPVSSTEVETGQI